MRARLLASVIVLTLVVAAFAGMPACVRAEVGDLVLASSTAGGAAGTSQNNDPTISANGRYVAFTSFSTNLPGGNGQMQVYRKDLSTGAIVLASRTAGGVVGDSFSGWPSISDDGRYVAFQSFATNFPGSTPTGQVYRKDLSNGMLILVSSTAAGTQGDAGGYEPSMNADGRYVVFWSNSTNFPSYNTQPQVYRKDLSGGGAIILVSKTAAGAAGDVSSQRPSMSPDGRYVAFTSSSANFPHANGASQVFRKDMTGGTLVLASSTSGGAVGSGWSDWPCLSTGGRYVVFQSSSPNLPHANGAIQVYRKDLSAGALELVTSTTQGVTGSASSLNSARAVTADGRYVAFNSTAAEFPGSNGLLQIYRKDMTSGELELVSATAGGVPGAEGSGPGSTGPEAISSGGRFVAFISDSDNFPGHNGQFQVYRKEMATPNSTWYLAEGTTAWGFSTYITIENPNAVEVSAKVDYMPTGLANKSETVSLPANSQTTLTNDHLVQVMGQQADFSTKVTCLDGQLIAVDRTMEWTGPGAASSEAHSSIGVTAPAKKWYLPEGSSAWGFECWLLIQNPNASAATCQVTYMIEGEGPQTFTKEVPAHSRQTYNMADDIGSKDASIKVTSDVPVIPERAMYRNNRREGHDSIGTTTTMKNYYLAEGATGYDVGYITYVLVQNPQNTPTDVQITYLTGSGKVTGPAFTMPANSRKTVRVNDQLAPNTDVSTFVRGSQEIIAERAMYWDNGTGEACHDSIGMADPAMNFYLPDGETSNGRETWTLVQNPNDTDVQVGIAYLPAGGGAPITFVDTIPANSRKTYNMADKGVDGRAAIMVNVRPSDRPVVVERAMYWNTRGAGTDTIGGSSD